MKKLLLILIPSLVLVTGCQRTMFGMPESQFQSLNPRQQQEVIRSYNRQQEIDAQNAPMYALADVAHEALRHSGPRYRRSASTSREHCYMEGNTRVCKQRSSGASFGFGVY